MNPQRGTEMLSRRDRVVLSVGLVIASTVIQAATILPPIRPPAGKLTAGRRRSTAE